MMVFRPIRNGLLLVLTLVLCACGFHLRGQSTLGDTYSTLGIRGMDGLPVRQALVARLERSGVNLTEKATVRIILIDEDVEKRVSAFSARAKSAAFELKHKVTFKVIDTVEERELIPETELLVRRQLLFREDQLVGKLEEEAQLWREMVQELADRVVRKLETFSENPP